jgi:cytochrome c oxidase cbb3-type subunit III
MGAGIAGIRKDSPMKRKQTRQLAGALAAMAFAVVACMGDAHAGDRRKFSGKLDPAGLYHNYCSVCHGDAGDGNSRAKGSLIPPPADFTDVKLQPRYTQEYIAAIIKHGKAGTAMTGWKTQLNDNEIDALAQYVKASFVDHAGDASLKRGRALFGQNCVGCHGVTGNGIATGNASNPPPRDLTSPASRKELSRERILLAVAVGKKGTAMNGFAGTMSPQDIEAVTDYVQKWLMTGQSTAISGVNAHAGREPRK